MLKVGVADFCMYVLYVFSMCCECCVLSNSQVAAKIGTGWLI